jgi:hypothetical protein
VQIIEVTDLGARTAVLTLARKASPMRFVVFPMIHLADAKFYAAVQKRLADCQVVVAEGIQGTSTTARALSRSYRLLKHKKSLGMVVQKLDYDALGAEVLQPDMTGAQMDRDWHDVPLRQRFLTSLLVPLFVVWMLFFGSRRVLAQRLATDDLPTPKQQAESDALDENFAETQALILDRRDQLLIDALAKIHEKHSEEPIKVAVVYGARSRHHGGSGNAPALWIHRPQWRMDRSLQPVNAFPRGLSGRSERGFHSYDYAADLGAVADVRARAARVHSGRASDGCPDGVG